MNLDFSIPLYFKRILKKLQAEENQAVRQIKTIENKTTKKWSSRF